MKKTIKELKETLEERKISSYNDGYEQGYDDGYEQGYDDGYANIQTDEPKWINIIPWVALVIACIILIFKQAS